MKTNKFAILILVLLCVLSNTLEVFVNEQFKYIDEALWLIFLIVAICLLTKTTFRRSAVKYFLPLIVFTGSCFLGNIIYGYQSFAPIVIDVVANVKFWLTVATVYVICEKTDLHRYGPTLLSLAKVISACLFVVFILERFRIFFEPSFDNDNFLHIHSAKLIYAHPTYAAAAMVFLLSILLLYFNKQKSCLFYIVIDTVMLFFTFRSKAYGAVVLVLAMLYLIKKDSVIKLWQVLLGGVAVIFVGWEKFSAYYVNVAASYNHMTARTVMTYISPQIMMDHFPFGTGFATFASHQASVSYSPIYVLYGLAEHPELGIATKVNMVDVFWPIIIAQAGFIGLIAFVAMVLVLIRKALSMQKTSINHYAASLFLIGYLLVDSIAETAFNNPIAVPFAIMLGFIFANSTDKQKEILPAIRDDWKGRL